MAKIFLYFENIWSKTFAHGLDNLYPSPLILRWSHLLLQTSRPLHPLPSHPRALLLLHGASSLSPSRSLPSPWRLPMPLLSSPDIPHHYHVLPLLRVHLGPEIEVEEEETRRGGVEGRSWGEGKGEKKRTHQHLLLQFLVPKPQRWGSPSAILTFGCLLVTNSWGLVIGLAAPCWGIRVKIRSAAVSMVLGRKYLFSLDQMAEFDKVHMRRIVGFVLAVILSGHSSILAQRFVRGDINKFLSSSCKTVWLWFLHRAFNALLLSIKSWN